MIYTYKYLNHRIQGFHEKISYFFEKLFDQDLSTYNENLLLEIDFIPLVNRSQVTLKTNLERITIEYHKLSTGEKETVKNAFLINSKVQELCDNPKLIPLKYNELPQGISNLLKEFLTMLWEEYPQNMLLENSFGTVQEHFNAFVSPTHQKAFVCPFCGLNKLKTSESANRDAYDHYIPKALYPFISINFYNLFPICHECNSDEKKTTDILYDGSTRRKVFFPIDSTYKSEELSITINSKESFNPVTYKTLLKDINWDFTMLLNNQNDSRLDSWDKIFHIKRRYRENILCFQIEWYEEIVIKYRREKKKNTLFKDFINEILEDAEFQKTISPLGILRYSYFSFLFSYPDLENRLNEVVT